MERVAGTKAGEYFPDLAAPTEHRRALGEQLAAPSPTCTACRSRL